jgi:hypothetical protein
LNLLEASLLITSSCEWEENLSLNSFHVEVSEEGDVLALYTFI